ncbi:hypothetical protein [Komagataeibacter rhaeticus]|uniref:Uncharacterized protein n=1 Tax=Komagataeibacter rhaeticus TaxID=215221 RepID=A0A181C9S8_9PROT|nr:hypothetical protein [Komagataeibacter rhaeticus]ATU73121.1 hypothetical protein CT154_10035 [Komagataeibacter xylinus]QIP35136.1 hypothetical protein GWK63_06300 [Komagataeibacter rhaeticus]QOC47692.1 hypothetical protein ICJ78_06370 [Komagataeibacter rhaeticus]WPP22947.1 hypothetical protein SCD25_05550 [Komagataeibacter rhaeticus]SAY48302.1 hypothetical protein KRIGEM_01249 [Komagataeibacter rhaeticus]
MFESSVIEVDGVFVGVILHDGPLEPYRFRAMHERVTQMDGDTLPTFEAAVSRARARYRMGHYRAPRALDITRCRA